MKWIRKPVKENQSPEPAGASRPSSPGRTTIEDIVARIRRYNADVDPASDRFRAAVLLLAALEFGQNIDVLARRTGYDRAFVARCARRLIDNGVWQSGRTVAEWSSADEASGSFWNDVAVAEGKMCRRIIADDSLEWAPAGYWNKSFQYVDKVDERIDNLYHDPGATETGKAAPPDAEPSASGGGSNPPSDRRDDEIGPGTQIGVPPDSEDTVPERGPQKPAEEGVPSLDRLFRDAIWIG